MHRLRSGLILAAAGIGSRLGGQKPKQFLDYRGTPVFVHALRPFFEFIEEAVVVVPSGWEEVVQSALEKLPSAVPTRMIEGGPTRQQSVFNGLRQLDSSLELVTVHDAARPFVTADLIDRVQREAERVGACVPAIPVRDTVKIVREGRVESTPLRDSLRLIQTPQAFRRSILEEAFARARTDEYEGSDEASLVERLGLPVVVVEGDRSNIKITWKEDLKRVSDG